MVATQGLAPLPGRDLMQYPIRGLAPPATCFGPFGAWHYEQIMEFRDRNYLRNTCPTSELTSAFALFPRFYGARNNSKEWMCFRQSDALESGEALPASPLELGLEMRPLVLQLSVSEGKAPSIAPAPDLLAVEVVTTPGSFRLHLSQILGNASERPW